MTKRSLVEQFLATRVCSAPLVPITTADQWAVIEALGSALNGAPRFLWTCFQGISALNKEALAYIEQKVGDPKELGKQTRELLDALDFALTLPEKSLLFLLNAHRFIDEPRVASAIHCTRNPFKATRRALVPLGPSFRWPEELRRDVIQLDDPLPTAEALATISAKLHKAARVEVPKDQTSIVDAVRGLGAYEAEQALAMAMTEKGLDVPSAWARKVQSVPPGLTVTVGEAPAEVVGLSQVLAFGDMVFNGKRRPGAVLRLDEFEKQTAGAGTDTSGVQTRISGRLLSWMEDRRHGGIVCEGPPGTGKSLLSKVLGAKYGVPTMALDVPSLLSRYVGDSEGNFNACLAAADAIAGDRRIFVIATCNALATITAEMRRRFTGGIWFFDLPTDAELLPAWKLYLKVYKLDETQPLPESSGWTPAEVRNCCELAADSDVSLIKASEFILPVSRSSPQIIEALRAGAHGTFFDVNRPGSYRRPGSLGADFATDLGRKLA